MKHPDYPDIDFKPAIARYDWDQTYDVLEFVHLPQGFDGLMQQLGIPAFELMAIDRYTPYNYLWAEEYSDYVYNFLKQFNFSPNSSQIDYDLYFNIATYSRTAGYKVSLTEGSYAVTGLVYQGWKDGVIGSIPTINQASYRFTLSETTEIDLNSIIKHWCKDDSTDNIGWEYNGSTWVQSTLNRFCINSLVLSKLNGSQWESVAVDAPPFLFYQDIADHWESLSVTIKNNYVRLQEYLAGFSSEASINRFEPLITHPETEYYDIFPSHFRDFCYLQRANNNKWGGVVLADLGIEFVPKIINSLTFYPLSILPSQGVTPLPFGNTKKVLEQNDMLSAILRTHTTWSNIGGYAYYSDGKNTLNLQISSDEGYPKIVGSTLELITTEVSTTNTYPTYSGYGSGVHPSNATYARGIRYRPLLGYYQFGKSVDCEELRLQQEVITPTLTSYLVLRKYRYYIDSYETTTESITELTTWTNNAILEYGHDPSGQSIPSYPFVDTITLTINLYSQSEWLDLYSYNAQSDEDYLAYLLTTKAQLEAFMVDSVRLKEIHACLGAGEFAYYDNNGNPTPYNMHIARNIDFLMKSFGIYYNPDGSIQSVVLNPAPPESEP
jgi:hypothetical protein